MTGIALAIWMVTLLFVILVIVPVALSLLGRALAAARAIERYLADMLEAGVKIVGHTEAVPALNETLATACAMGPVAKAIEEKTGAVAAVLSERAKGE